MSESELRLDPAALHRACSIESSEFADTRELEDIDISLGQDRAREAVEFGMRMAAQGFNIYALGPPGLGKLTSVRQQLRQEAARRPAPSEWCYVNNFDQPHKPRALRLPAGYAQRFAADMDALIHDLRSSIPAAFEGEQYQSRASEIESELKERQHQALEKVREQAREKRVALMHTPNGFAFAPMTADDEPMRPEQFHRLSESEQKRIQGEIEELQEELQKVLRQFPAWAKEVQEKVRELNREFAHLAASHLLESLKERYRDLPEVLALLERVENDIVDNVDEIRAALSPQGQQQLQQLRAAGAGQSSPLQRYEVNVMVDHADGDGAPLVHEDLPTYQNLLGRVEHQAQMGALVTNFTLIKPGALHRANGGYLLLDVRQVLTQPLAWDALKRALQAREIRIHSLEQRLSLMSTVSLEPEAIPMDVKVVLIGDRLLYYLLSEYDPDFRDLFKVAADFEDTIERDGESTRAFARLLASVARRESLLPLARDGVERVIEQAARLADDAGKLSTHLRSLADLLRESDHWAREAGAELISREHVQSAIDKQVRRSDRVRERVHEAIEQGTVLIDTEGARVGQVNGLAVLQLGGFGFGKPSRITARTRLGEGKVVDIERETELGGAIHAKGVLILSSFLAARYSRVSPLSISASIVFEQSYGTVEGDSASLAELCALLSSLADVPVRQGIAVTGSVNQHGEVQPIGGVNEKIEGFFDVCATRGLNGEQGVIVPAANVRHLMLRADVVDAAGEGRFHVWAVSRVDQALELFTAMAAGEPDDAGHFPPDTVNGKVERQLEEYADMRRRFGRESRESGDREP